MVKKAQSVDTIKKINKYILKIVNVRFELSRIFKL